VMWRVVRRCACTNSALQVCLVEATFLTRQQSMHTLFTPLPLSLGEANTHANAQPPTCHERPTSPCGRPRRPPPCPPTSALLIAPSNATPY
jgi:hypothetical protein